MTPPNITIHDLRQIPGVTVTTVPTVQQMIRENRLKAAVKAQTIEQATDEAAAQLSSNLSLAQTLADLRNMLAKAYPDASVLLMGSRPIDAKRTNVIYEFCGKEETLQTCLCECMHHSMEAIRLVNRAMVYFVKTASADEAEMGITALQDIIKDLQNRNDPKTQITLKQSEVKRLRKAGRMDLVKIKEQEIAEIQQRLRDEELAAARKADLHRRRCIWLASAREALAAIREKKRRAKMNPPQPNFAKMAKQKRQQIAARQAEKKKKKAGSGSSDDLRSCSQLLTR